MPTAALNRLIESLRGEQEQSHDVTALARFWRALDGVRTLRVLPEERPQAHKESVRRLCEIPDEESIRDDWATVGMDFYVSLDLFSQRHASELREGRSSRFNELRELLKELAADTEKQKQGMLFDDVDPEEPVQ